jgi:hypothetical protein
MDDNTDLHIPVTLNAALSIISGDKDAKYVSEKNGDFLEETGIIKNYKYNDAFLRPPMESNCFYDLLTASQNTETLLQYNVNYRNFYLVTHGVIKIKLIPPKSARYLYPVDDYENFEFRSRINPWSVASNYKKDFEKTKCLEVVLEEGKTIFIPPYWWYSIEFSANSSFVVCLKYRTYMNNVAILPYTGMYFLQNQNVKRNSHKTKTADVAVSLTEEEKHNDFNKEQQEQIENNQPNNDVDIDSTLVPNSNALNNAVTEIDANNEMFLGSSNKLLFSEI